MEFTGIQGGAPSDAVTVGNIIAVRGSKAEAGLGAAPQGRLMRVTVGSFLVIEAGGSSLICVVTCVYSSSTATTSTPAVSATSATW